MRALVSAWPRSRPVGITWRSHTILRTSAATDSICDGARDRCVEHGPSGGSVRKIQSITLREYSSAHAQLAARSWQQQLKGWNRDVNYLIRDLEVGKMTHADRSLAHRCMKHAHNRGDSEGARKMEQLLERLVEEDEAGNYNVANVTTGVYHFAIGAWAKSRDVEHAAHRAEAILELMEERYESHIASSSRLTASKPRRFATPDTQCYDLALKAFSICEDNDSTDRAERIVQRMELLGRHPDSPVRPQTSTYNYLINVYASRVGEYGIGQKAEDILLGMAQKNNEGEGVVGIDPDTYTFNVVLKAWLNSGEGGFESARRAESILRLMAKLQRAGHNYVRPDAVSFSTCLQAYANAGGGEEVVESVEGLLKLIEETSPSKDVTRCFESAVRIILNSGTQDASKRVSRVIQQVDKLREDNYLTFREDFDPRLVLLDAPGRDKKDAGKEAEIMCRDMIHYIRKSCDGSLDGNSSVKFGKLIKTILYSGQVNSLERVDQLIAEMESTTRKGGVSVCDATHYNMLIGAYSKSKAKDAAEKSYNLLKRMQTSLSYGNRNSRPDYFAYASVIAQLDRSGAREGDKKAYQVLRMMEAEASEGNVGASPKLVDYNVVIKMLSKASSRKKAELALELFRRLESMYEEGEAHIRPDEFTMASIICAFTNINDKKRARAFALEFLEKADDGSLSNCIFLGWIIRGLTFGAELEHAEKAHEILLHMNRIEQNAKYGSIDAKACNMVVSAYASCERGVETASKAQSVLIDLVSKHRNGELGACPDRIAFNAVMMAWSKARVDKGEYILKNTDMLLRLMNEMHALGIPDIQPDKHTVTLALRVMAKFSHIDGVVTRARKLFDDADRKDKFLFDAFLNVLAKSSEKDKHREAKQVLDTMKESNSGAKADVLTHNIVLNACAQTDRVESKPDALEVAYNVFACMSDDEGLRPDNITCSTFLRSIINFSLDGDERKEKGIKVAVELCKEGGYLSRFIVSQLTDIYGSRSGVLKALGVKDGSKLPKEWSSSLRIEEKAF